MPQAEEITSQINLDDPQYYFNRELGWLEFNRRVLHEALDPRTPLLERVKFAAIFSSNLDEFFMVRVAILKDQVAAQVSELSPDGRTPQQQLDAINEALAPMIAQLQQLVQKELRPALEQEGVYLLLDYAALTPEQQRFLQKYYEENVFPILTPLSVNPSHPFPLMANLSLNLAVLVKDPETGEENFARVKVPDSLPRFIEFPPELRRQEPGRPSVWTAIPLEQVIAGNIETLFPGMTIQEHHVFRITRDADLEVREDDADDLLETIEQELSKRRFGGNVVRLQVPTTMSDKVLQTLKQGMKISEKEIYPMPGILGLRALFGLMGLPLAAHLKDKPWNATVPRRLKPVMEAAVRDADEDAPATDIFSIISSGDLLVHHPYESFTASVEQFITAAATDPQVQAIKMTLYRTSGDSPIVKALITAAENAKQVAALVELKARFDEASNINWARTLEDAGVHVIYGLLGLKTHTKIVLVVRQEGNQLKRYVHIGTGNYNPKTARLYTDLSLLSCRDELGADLTDLFNYLTGFSKQKSYRKLLVAPVTLRSRMLAMIRREMDHARQGKRAFIHAKMNALVDVGMIRALYEASQAGVEVELLVRGICCLRPGIPGVSENIRVVSIVGRFLEHSRIYHFYNDGQEEIYIGSADWMTRNLDRRVEAVTPVEDPSLCTELKEIMAILRNDNRHAWDLQADGSYVQRRPAEGETTRDAQTQLMERALQNA
jgi:polyphosphate kinase